MNLLKFILTIYIIFLKDFSCGGNIFLRRKEMAVTCGAPFLCRLPLNKNGNHACIENHVPDGVAAGRHGRL
jgi:hypothetical protein